MVLRWTAGADNNAPITNVCIEYVVGFHRPLYPHSLQTQANYHPISFDNLKKAVSNHQWSKMKHQFSKVNTQVDVAFVNLTGKMAVIKLASDVAYQFRIRLMNKVGLSEASALAPGVETSSQEKCILPSTIPVMQPSQLKVFGRIPNTLTITWEVITYF